MPVTEITSVHAREVFDSRGNPTVEVDVVCGGSLGRAIVPSGASTGAFESHELRDGDERLGGRGVMRAVRHVNTEIAETLRGQDASDQAAIDGMLCDLDGTPDKSRLGANAILGASLAVAHAAAAARGAPLVRHLHELWRSQHESPQRELTLPLPMVNMISGGLHAGRKLDFQDYLILPVGAATYRQALEWVITVYRGVAEELRARNLESVLVGDEGGYGPQLPDNEAALECLVAAIERSGLTPGDNVAIGLDVASTHFAVDGGYRLAAEQGKVLSTEEMIDRLAGWVDRYPIASIEDGLVEDDWDGWQRLTERLGRIQILGDDLFTTNPERIRKGIACGAANSVLIKLNQIGTLTETFDAIAIAQQAGYRPVVSARSGETEDATIADLAVATGAGQIKIGSIARSERLAKYNQLLRLEEMLGDEAGFAGGGIVCPQC